MNLRDYTFVDSVGRTVKGSDVDYVIPDQTILIESPAAITKTSKHPAEAKAFLDYLYTPAAQRKVALAKADGEYSVAKEKCGAMKGNEKDACVKDAKANHDRAKVEAKANAKVGEARQDAREEHRDAARERAKGS